MQSGATSGQRQPASQSINTALDTDDSGGDSGGDSGDCPSDSSLAIRLRSGEVSKHPRRRESRDQRRRPVNRRRLDDPTPAADVTLKGDT